MRGRTPTPNSIKVARGSRHVRTDEPTPDAGTPECPDYLDDVAKEHWAVVVAIMAKMEVVTMADADALTLYCSNYSIWRDAMKNVQQDGPVVKSPNGYPIQNPFLAIMNASHDRMERMLSRFGFTPADRARVHKENKQDRPAATAPSGPPKLKIAN